MEEDIQIKDEIRAEKLEKFRHYVINESKRELRKINSY